MVLSDLSWTWECDLSPVSPDPLITCDKWQQLIIRLWPPVKTSSSPGQIRSDISHDDISDSDHSDHCSVKVSQESDPCVTGDLIMIMVISDIITPNDTHHHPHLTLSRVLSGTTLLNLTGPDKMSRALSRPWCHVSVSGTTGVTCYNGLIIHWGHPGWPHLATTRITSPGDRDLMEISHYEVISGPH